MDSLILELVNIDRTARERVESVKAWRAEQEQDIANEKVRLSAELAAERERRLDLVRAEADKGRDALIERYESEYAALSDDLERQLDANRAEWTEALYKRVLEC